MQQFPVSKAAIIDMGIRYLREMGADQVCNVCIANGGSCCSGCRHLSDGVGCQLRNTSCTAWLCGFLKYILFETGLLEEWYDFWDQVPGQQYREDFTPELVHIRKALEIPNLRKLGAALAEDLDHLSDSHIAIGFIITLREKIDKNIDEFFDWHPDSVEQKKIKRKIALLSSYFTRFKAVLANDLRYRDTTDRRHSQPYDR